MKSSDLKLPNIKVNLKGSISCIFADIGLKLSVVNSSRMNCEKAKGVRLEICMNVDVRKDASCTVRPSMEAQCCIVLSE